MAYFNNAHSIHEESFDHVDPNKEFEQPMRQYYGSEHSMTTADSGRSNRGLLVIVTFILEFLIVSFVVVIEYFLRFTNAFPVVSHNFSCSDPEISFSGNDGSLSEFTFDGEIPEEVIYALSFCVPPFVIVIGEICVWASTSNRQKTIRVGCECCCVPQVFRRIFRFAGVFLFGCVALLLFLDVSGMLTGRLRPVFLEICNIDRDACLKNNGIGTIDMCQNTDKLAVRDAQMSFPSSFAALTAYSAIFISIYIHNAIRTHAVRILRPFLCLGFVMMSLLCGLTQIQLNKNHWTDVVVGFLVGAFMATYLGLCILHKFQEHIPQERFFEMMNSYLMEQRLQLDPRHVSGYRIPTYQPVMHIPRPHARREVANDSHIDAYDTFQRDLSRTIESAHVRRTPAYPNGSHM